MPTVVHRENSQARKIPGPLMHDIAKRFGGDMQSARFVVASLHKSGLDSTLKRFPHENPADITRVATMLAHRALIDLPDTQGASFLHRGLNWTVCPPCGLDSFQFVTHDRDIQRSQLRLTFKVCDVLIGVGEFDFDAAPTDLLEVLANDPTLRVRVAHVIRDVACLYTRRALESNAVSNVYFRKHTRNITESLLSPPRMMVCTSLLPRITPHFGDGSEFHIGIDASFALVVETSMVIGPEGRVLDGVEIEDRGAYFEISGGAVDTLRAAAAEMEVQGDAKGAAEAEENAAKVEALTGPIRRLRERQVLEEGPPGALHQQVVMIDPEKADQPITLEIHGPATTVQKMASNIQDAVKTAESWWGQHRGLIKPTIPDIATKIVGVFGADVAEVSDVETLVDLALPSLQEVASKRQSQFLDFGVDAAVVALGNLLRTELSKRLR